MENQKDRKPTLCGSRSFLKNRAFITLVCAFIIYVIWQASQLVLVIAPEGDKKPIVIESHKGDKWYISLTHSVEKTKWEEFFTINGVADMTMTHTTFESLGWGYPYSSTDGTFSCTNDGKFQMVMNRHYKEVPLRVSEQAMQQIIHENAQYNLVELYGQGSAVTVRIMRRYHYWFDLL